MSKETICISCQKKVKAPVQCNKCSATVCKDCAVFIDPDDYIFFNSIPKILTKNTFCHVCFDREVDPLIQKYNDLMEQAKSMNIFMINQSKETRLMKRTEKPIRIEQAPDERELLLRLAFRAAELGFNTLIDVNVVSKKVRMGTYQTSIWSGQAIPVMRDNL